MTHSFPTRRSPELPCSARACPSSDPSFVFSGLGVVDHDVVHAPNSVMSQILNLDERGVEFGTDHHTQSDEVEKEKRDHDPGQTAVSRVIAEQAGQQRRSEAHTSELKSLMRNSYADFCLQKN